MARITYDTTTIGGKMVAETVDDLILIKDTVDRIASILKETTYDGNLCAQIEVGGLYGTVFGVEVGKGSSLYSTVIGFQNALADLSNDALADVDMGG